MTDSKALVLVDFEQEWITEDSDYYVGDISKTLERTNQLIKLCRESGYRIIFTTHIESDSDKEFAPNTDRVEIIDSLDIEDGDILIKKYRISPFFKTTLERDLEGVTDIVCCGILTNLCVRSLVHDAYDRDFEITIVEDCCVAFNKKIHEFTLEDLKETREEIKIESLKEFKP